MSSGSAPAREPFRALRLRLTARFTGLVLLVLVVGGGAFYAYMRHALFAAARSVAELAALSVLETVDTRWPELAVRQPAFDEEAKELRLTLGVEVVELWSGEGQLLAQSNALGPPLPPVGPAQEQLELGGQPLHVHRSAVGARGVLVLARRESQLAQALSALLEGMLLVIPLTLLGALAAGWVMAGQSIRPLRKAFDEQRAFMADASHELRTPLAIILTQAEVALDAPASPDSLRGALEVAARTARQLGRLVDDLLFLARADSAALLPRWQQFALGELLEETVEAFGPLARSSGKALSLALPQGELTIEADPDQLQRLVGVLLDNAIRYAGPGAVAVRVAREGKQVVLRVEDSGPGMPPELLASAFHRFTRGDASRSSAREGSGLGLSIALAIAQAHGGTLALESMPGAGTVATVRLPAARVPRIPLK